MELPPTPPPAPPVRRSVPWRRLAFGAAVLLIVCVCGPLAFITSVTPTQPSASAPVATGLIPTLAPSATAAPTAVAPQVEPDTFASGGLGLSREAWEATHGSGTESAGFVLYENKSFAVLYLDNYVAQLEFGFDTPGGVESARSVATALGPRDHKLIRTYTTDTDQLVDLYMSETLADRFPADAWINGEPGNFIVIYRRNVIDESVSGIVLGLGNNP